MEFAYDKLTGVLLQGVNGSEYYYTTIKMALPPVKENRPRILFTKITGL
jgi:hypothetical protein